MIRRFDPTNPIVQAYVTTSDERVEYTFDRTQGELNYVGEIAIAAQDEIEDLDDPDEDAKVLLSCLKSGPEHRD